MALCPAGLLALLFTWIVASSQCCPQELLPAGPNPSLVLSGTVRGSQNNTYVQVPFQVPSGTHRITLTFDYTGKEKRTTLDLGMLDPDGLRCWSGGNKRTLTVSKSDATPSCLPGPIRAGTWKVLVGIPNIRPGETATYTATLYFTKTDTLATQPPPSRTPLRAGPAWFRGDLHMHTGHSDGSCNSLTGKKVPCPVFVTLDAAVRRGLDFVSITDHNTTSHYDSMRELAPYFDRLLLIPGREITTFQGHANVFGIEEFIDFRLGSPGVPNVNTILHQAEALGGLVSINHPNAPSGEACMGCGWTPSPPADFALIQAIEAVNSGAEEGPYSGLSFWDTQLDAGHRLTGVGGSDNHTPQRPIDEVGSVGSPTTVVYAPELSASAILQGIRAGHVFIDLTGSRDRLLDVRATSDGATSHMGDLLSAPAGGYVSFFIHVANVNGATVVFREDGKPMPQGGNTSASDPDQTSQFEWSSDGRRHWFRAEVRSPEGKLLLLGNPIYINWSTSPEAAKP